MAESAAQKRVTALTGYLVAVLAVAASLGLYRLDAESYREDAQALLRLQRLSNWLATVDADSLDLPVRAAGREALRTDRPELHAQLVAARETITSALIRGLPDAPPVSCAAFREQVFEGKAPSRRARAEVPFDLMAVASPFLASSGTVGLADKDTVTRLLEQLDALYAPTTLHVARGLELPSARGDPCADWDGSPAPPDAPELLSVTLSVAPPAARVRFSGPPLAPYMQQALTQGETEVMVPADVVAVEGPNTARLLAATAPAGLIADLDGLAGRPATVARVRNEFGFLPINYAVTTAGAALVQGFTGATVMGLRLTQRRVALVIAAVVLALSAALAAEARRARRAGASLAADEPGGMLALASGSTAGRLALWTAAPAASIAAVAPSTPPWLAAAGLAAALGALATTWAAGADRAARAARGC